MSLPDAELVRALTPAAVLMIIALGIAYAGFKDRNRRIDEIRADRDARLGELREQLWYWRRAFELSESARLGRTFPTNGDALKDAKAALRRTEETTPDDIV